MCANVAILGLGIMGAALARSAARAGLRTTGWDRSAERASTIATDRVHITETARNAVQDA
jgi:3-hydroxyisobutyrate dehydrogenase